MADTPKHIRVDMPKAVPADVAKQTFGSNLPQLDNSEGGAIPDGATYSDAEVKAAVEKSGMGRIVEPEKEVVKEDENPTEVDDTTGKPKSEGGEGKVEKAEEEDPFKGELEEEEVKEKNGLPEFLKPPVKPKDGKEEKTVEEEVNYADFTPQEVGHMKNMNKQARREFARLIKENKDLSSAKTNSFMQHPQGYLLSPEYQELQKGYSSATIQVNHWKQMLLNCKAGKNIQDLDMDDKGNIVTKGDFKPTDELEEQCRAMMLQCQTAQRDMQGKMNEFPQKYSSMVSKDFATIRQEIKAKCPWVAKPELLDYTVEVKYPNGVSKQESIKTIRDNFINMFPPYLRNNNIGLEVAANLMVANVLNEAKVRYLEGSKKVAETKVKEVARAEPSGAKGKPGPKPKVHGVSEFNMNGAGIELLGM